MDVLALREFCLSLPHAAEEMPWGDDVLVFKVMGRMFAYCDISQFTWVGVKCDPVLAAELRETLAEVGFASHMSKVHWISVRTDGRLDDSFIRARVGDSYGLVVAGLSRSQREKLMSL